MKILIFSIYFLANILSCHSIQRPIFKLAKANPMAATTQAIEMPTYIASLTKKFSAKRNYASGLPEREDAARYLYSREEDYKVLFCMKEPYHKDLPLRTCWKREIVQVFQKAELSPFDLKGVKRLGGLANQNFKLIFSDRSDYLLKIPYDVQLDLEISRMNEAKNIRVLQDMKVMPDVLYMDPDTGMQIRKFLDGSPIEDFSTEDIKGAAYAVRNLHSSKYRFVNDVCMFKRVLSYQNFLEQNHSLNVQLKEFILFASAIHARVEQLSTLRRVPCHNDLEFANMLRVGKQIKILDWEFCGNGSGEYDLAHFIYYDRLSKEQELYFLNCYFNGTPPENILKSLPWYKYLAQLVVTVRMQYLLLRDPSESSRKVVEPLYFSGMEGCAKLKSELSSTLLKV